MTLDRHGLPAERDTRWRDDAACSGMDPNVFFPVDEGRSASSALQAKSVCRGCPVRGACMHWATTVSVDYGVWGGFTGDERRALRFRATRRRSPSR